MALVLYGEPAQALEVAQAVFRKGPVHAGVNYGPLALSSRGADAKVFGDGLVGAAAAARFATPERLLLTQDFAKALEATSPERAGELSTAGEFTDTRVRLHSFFTPDEKRKRARRRDLIMKAVAGVSVILFAGVLAREAVERLFPPPPATIRLVVKPRGEVYVNGMYKGRTPPVTEFQVLAGKHLIEIKSAGSPTVEIPVELTPGEQMTITHTFGSREKPKAKPKEEPGFWRDLQRRFGAS
jgi:hypothetical protein